MTTKITATHYNDNSDTFDVTVEVVEVGDPWETVVDAHLYMLLVASTKKPRDDDFEPPLELLNKTYIIEAMV